MVWLDGAQPSSVVSRPRTSVALHRARSTPVLPARPVTRPSHPFEATLYEPETPVRPRPASRLGASTIAGSLPSLSLESREAAPPSASRASLASRGAAAMDRTSRHELRRHLRHHIAGSMQLASESETRRRMAAWRSEQAKISFDMERFTAARLPKNLRWKANGLSAEQTRALGKCFDTCLLQKAKSRADELGGIRRRAEATGTTLELEEVCLALRSLGMDDKAVSDSRGQSAPFHLPPLITRNPLSPAPATPLSRPVCVAVP
jgi:hypothetical protein